MVLKEKSLARHRKASGLSARREDYRYCKSQRRDCSFTPQDPFFATALTIETISPSPSLEVIVAPSFMSSADRITFEELSKVMLYPLASVLSGLTEFKLRLSVSRLDRCEANTERSD